MVQLCAVAATYNAQLVASKSFMLNGITYGKFISHFVEKGNTFATINKNISKQRIHYTSLIRHGGSKIDAENTSMQNTSETTYLNA